MTGTPRTAILAACDALEAARERLCALDAVAGDGDHGVTMALAARAVRTRLDAASSEEPAEVVQQAGLAVASVGGTIGAIYGIGLARVAATLRADAGAGGATARARGATAVAHACAGAALDAITQAGRASPGDKTVVDALGPVVAALAEAERRGTPLTAALEAAVVAAEAGAASTTGMTARVGRAARLGDRSLGSPDAGATSFALALRAAVEAGLGRPLPEGGGAPAVSATAEVGPP